MKQQALVFVKRNRITAWKRLVLTGNPISFLYGSNDKVVFPNLCNCILWVIASYPNQPPTLVAKLDVMKVCLIDDPALEIDQQLLSHFRKYKWIAKATSNSLFFGHNDAGDAILNTTFQRLSGEAWRLSDKFKQWTPKCGIYLQGPRLLQPDINSLNPLEKLADKSSESVFISWKRHDWKGKYPLVLKLATLLAQQGFMVWLDKLALPMWKDKDQSYPDMEAERDLKLEKLLKYGYEQCKYILAINSRDYGIQSKESGKNWTMWEWDGMISKSNHPIKVCLEQGGINNISGTARFVINGDDPEFIVGKFAEIANNLKDEIIMT